MHAASIHPSQLLHRRRPYALLLLLALGVCAPVVFAAQQPEAMHKGERHESRREIDQLEEAWRNAVLKADIATMNSLLAEDYMAITPNGTLQTKEQALANLRSGATRVSSLEVTDRRVRFYGTTALVTSQADVSGTNAMGDFSGTFRYTRVYVRNAQGKWKIVSFEASRVREPGDRK
ncbi:MAG: nuclear transport factor 2 family protein [Terracidiphilus sp.]